jgi:AraC-like DNA-binding protein
LDNPVQWLEKAATQIDATVKNNSLILRGSANEGCARLFTLENGLTMILTDIQSNSSISNLRLDLPADYLFVKLYLPDYHLNSAAKSGSESHLITSPGVLLYNSHLKLRSIFETRQRFKIVSFAMHADWLIHTFPSDSIFIEKRLFEIPLFRFEGVTPAILQSALNLFTLKTDGGHHLLRMKAIVYDILSHLFSAFDLPAYSNITTLNYQSDIEAVFKIRNELLDTNYTKHLTVDVLAKQAAMSSSKLKKLFRSVFGTSIFKFYQHHRLDYARQLIEGRALAIGEIGLKIGYTNLSKFSHAYKRQFGYLPHQTLLSDRAII